MSTEYEKIIDENAKKNEKVIRSDPARNTPLAKEAQERVGKELDAENKKD